MKGIKFLLPILLFTFGWCLSAQAAPVKGKVTTADGEPVVGAYVLVKGEASGVLTDLDGIFEIDAAPQNVLVVAFMGMQTQEVAATPGVTVVLEPDSKFLDEVVVTAMGISREKNALGYATQVVQSDELTQGAATDLAGAMSGKLSGLQITPSSGMPGASTQITIRGARSFTGDNTPLYVVDGMPVASTASLSTDDSVTGADYSTRALDIDPNDIESINVLKGQAASALYGMRAGNGVIVITTKNGKNLTGGRPVVTISSNVAWSTASVLPETQNEFAQGSPYGTFNPNTSLAWGPRISELANDPNYGGNTVNDYTAALGMHPGQYYVPQRAAAGLDPWATPQAYNNIRDFFQTGFTWNNNASVAQNLGRGNYSFSIGNTHQTGIVPTTGMDRYNAKLNASAKLGKYFTTGASANFVKTNIKKQSGANDGIMAMVYGAPANYDLKGIPSHKENHPEQQNTYRATAGFPAPYWALENNSFTEESQRFFGNAYLDFKYPFTPDMFLDLKYQIGDDAYTTSYRDVFGYGYGNNAGEIDEMSYTSNELNSLFTATYDWNILPTLHLNILYGNEIVYTKTSFLDAWGQNFNFSGWNNLNNASNYSSSISRYQTLTFGNFYNVALDWNNILYFNTTGRYDLISTMPAGSRGFFYPSVSLGFVFTEIEALKNNVLTFGKLRASDAEVGMAGTYRKSYYETPAYGGGFYGFTPVSYPMGGVVAYTPSSTLYDENLRPQNTRSYEVGAELAFWEGLVSLEYTYSRQNVKDQIFSVPLAGSTGYAEKVMNAGSIHTNSHEVTLGLNPVRTKNVKWDLNVNFTKIDNYVDELAPGVESIYLGGFVEPQVRAGIGDKFPVIYGVGYVRDREGHVVVDSDGLPLVGEEKVIGSVSPDFTMGFNTTLEVYKVRLSATFDWKCGGDMYCGSYTMMDYYGTSKRSGEYRKKDKFLFDEDPAGSVLQLPDGTYVPNTVYINGSDAFYYYNRLNDISESFVHDTSFVKLREISLSYPISIGKRLTLTVSAFARNILIWSNLKGFDPEASQGNTNMSGAFERFSLPGASTYGGGLTFKF
ncbi:MAG: SusC/RagA family TonB-linked outer membrane protein [Bacteroidales bacterium]|nr:SusC/RagA family TonB-linked outer membrane protein [Bacteroidales bacterium]